MLYRSSSKQPGGCNMRATLVRVVPVLVVVMATGCILPGGLYSTANQNPPTATHKYWDEVNAALSRKPVGNELKTLLQLVREQTATLRELSPENVDPELVAAVEELIRCEEEVILRGELAGEDRANLLLSQSTAQLFADANRQAAAAKKQVKSLRKPLNARYGGGFASPGW